MRDLSSQDSGEMTMEEILASIRRYVAEDMPAKQTPQPEKVVRLTEEFIGDPSPAVVTPPSASRAREPEFSQADSRNYHLQTAEPIITPPPYEPPAASPAQTADAKGSGGASPFNRLKDAIDEQRDAAHSAHRATPAFSVPPGQDTWLKEFFADMARPFIERWLDKHMQNIVEDMVRREIEKMRNAS